MSHSHSHGHHAAGHGHEHSHHHHGDVSAVNQEYFDKIASTYDDKPGALEAARRITAAMRQEYAFDEEKTSVLDYACGTGGISRELAPYVKRIVGVDISQGMVDLFNTRVANQGIPPEEMRAVRCELKGEPGELDGEKFDVIVCALAYHHFASITETTRVLASFLNPGGVLLVADLLAAPIAGTAQSEEFISEQYQHAAPHRSGFDEPTMREAFESAGLGEFSLKDVTKTKLLGDKPVMIFIAKGVKLAVV